MATKYRSKIMGSMHRTVSDLHEIGGVDKKTMREFDRMCLTKVETLAAAEIRAIREKEGVSQAVFAEHLGVTAGLISKWECGDKHPSRMALKLLSLVKTKGLDAIA
jgi:putative transcriptional regulator